MPGGASNPKIVGSNASEYAFGTPDHDRIDGRGGADTINGFCGNDTITGGSGSDLFVMDRMYQNWCGGQDVIADFNTSAGGHDSVRFTGFGAFIDAPAGALVDGQSFTTDTGFTLMVMADDGGDLMLCWNTGDSFELRGVASGEMDGSWIFSV